MSFGYILNTSELKNNLQCSNQLPLLPDSNATILYFSPQWMSVLGYMFQCKSHLKGVFVDQTYHETSVSYDLSIDLELTEKIFDSCKDLHGTVKQIAYDDFPIDGATVIANNWLNPNGHHKVVILGYNIYASKEEVFAYGQRCAKAVACYEKPVIPFFLTESKYVEGQFQLPFPSKPFIEGFLGNTSIENNIVPVEPLDHKNSNPKGPLLTSFPWKQERSVESSIPQPVGPYPYGKAYGNLLFISGIGPRSGKNNEIPGLKRDSYQQVIDWDIVQETRSVVENLRMILDSYGKTLEDILDIQVFLTDMARDFQLFNKTYGEYFNKESGPTRTTVGVHSLPTPIHVEFKVVVKN